MRQCCFVRSIGLRSIRNGKRKSSRLFENLTNKRRFVRIRQIMAPKISILLKYILVFQEEPSDACPQCGSLLPQTSLECGDCKNTLPYCVVSGRHMLKDDWSECPNCSWPALYSVFRDFVANGETPCPICNVVVDPQQLKIIEDPNLYSKLGESTDG